MSAHRVYEGIERVTLGGYSDDVHTVEIDGEQQESYHPYTVEIVTPLGEKVTATARPGCEWRCEISLPAGSTVTVTLDDNT